MPQLGTRRGAGEIIVRKKAAVTLTLKEGPREVQAYVTSSPFLFVHRPFKRNGEGLCSAPKSGWTVTHGPTGLGCCKSPLNSLLQALAYAERFAGGAEEQDIDLDFADQNEVDGTVMARLGVICQSARDHVFEHVR